jgi:multimeric flavodoxin WrbA
LQWVGLRERLPGMELSALILNCTLKKSPEPSNTQGLIDMVTAHFDDLGVGHETLRPVDYRIPFGIASDMGNGDDWPEILERVLDAEILIMGMSIWFGVRSSVCQMVIERLDGTYNTTNEGRAVSPLQQGRGRRGDWQ